MVGEGTSPTESTPRKRKAPSVPKSEGNKKIKLEDMPIELAPAVEALHSDNTSHEFAESLQKVSDHSDTSTIEVRHEPVVKPKGNFSDDLDRILISKRARETKREKMVNDDDSDGEYVP